MTFTEFEELIEAEKFAISKDTAPEEEYYLRVINKKWASNRKETEKLMAKVEKDVKEKDKHLSTPKDSKEQDTLDRYVSIDYININSGLRKGKLNAKLQTIVDKIDIIINNEKTKEEIVVYRGVEPSAIEKSDAAFKSCSISPIVANNFVRGSAKLFRFKIPKNTNYAYIGGGEGEILFSRDFDLKKYLF